MGVNSNMLLHSMSTLPNNIYTNKSGQDAASEFEDFLAQEHWAC